MARQFDDFRKAESAGAVLMADSIESLASAMRVPLATFTAEWNDVEKLKSAGGKDRYGRKLRIVEVNGVSVGDTLVREGLARWYEGGRRPWC